MLERVLRDADLIARHRANLLGPWLDELADTLLRRGYTHAVVDGYVRGVVHFGRWLQLRGLGPAQIDDRAVRAFLAHGSDCRCGVARGTPSEQRYGVPHMREILRRRGVIVALRPPRPCTAVDRLIQKFAAHLRDHRGMTESGCAEYSRIALAFLSFRFGRAPIDLRRIRPLDVHRFMVRRARKWRPATMGLAGAALRRFLAFLQMRGLPTHHLALAIPRVPRWSLATIPKHLTSQQLAALLGSFDRAKPLGRRDYAMALCMARLGLRSGEVSAIGLEDVDWRGGTVRVTVGKGRRQSVLPLPPDVARAIVEYLRRGRPRTDCRRVFLTHLAPRGQPLSSRAVRTRINYAFVRAEIDCPSHGSHVLRHTAATHMIRAGVTLKEIADVLRHRNLDTTAVYAKVDLVHLTEIAQPWPGRAS